MEIKDFKVGQEVAILRSVKSRPEVLVSAVITKVGRKYVWARMSDNRWMSGLRKARIRAMNELLLNAQRARFGQSSEKKAYVMPAGQQLRLFDEAETEQAHKAPEPTEETIIRCCSQSQAQAYHG